MTRSTVQTSALCALFLIPLLSSCNLIDVTDSENSTSGRGAKVFDPYQASASGAIRLSLQYINGCAYTPTGGFVKRNAAVSPANYPDTCENLERPIGPVFGESSNPQIDPARVPPTGKLEMMSNTTYFLNQLSFTDLIVGKHKNPDDFTEAINWMKTQSRFKNLDWTNLGKVEDEWQYGEGYPGAFDPSWSHLVFFDNANWRRVTDDDFTIELLDAGGESRVKQTYARSEFLVDNPYSGHSRIAWSMGGVGPPQFPGDTAIHTVTARPGLLPTNPGFTTIVRMDVVGSTNPFKTFNTGNLHGEGAIKVTWSQLPEEPFYFPVTFIDPGNEELGTHCYDPSLADPAKDPADPTKGNVKCGFGLDPKLTLLKPANGEYYLPGERLNMFFEYRDNDGHRLHRSEELPSAKEIFSDQANGVVALLPPIYGAVTEADSTPTIMVGGPLQELRVNSNIIGERSFSKPDSVWPFVEDGATLHLVPSLFQFHGPTRYTYKLPLDAKPGTYVAFVKVTRYWMGERVSRNKPFFFQVGQPELTTYPGRVGNCQLCHRGVLSLDNLRHGVPVDHIEGCKICHDGVGDGNRTQEVVHRIHMRSRKYPMAKNDCTVCHLVRDSAIRPSLTTCSSCHPSMHDEKYFSTFFKPRGDPNRYANCGQACHAETTTPNNHILPAK